MDHSSLSMSRRWLREDAAIARARARAIIGALADVEDDIAMTLDRLAATTARGKPDRADQLRSLAQDARSAAVRARRHALDGRERSQSVASTDRPVPSSDGWSAGG